MRFLRPCDFTRGLLDCSRPTIHTVIGEVADPAVKSSDTPLESRSHVAPEFVECSIDPAGPMRHRTAGSGDAISVGVITCFDNAAARASSGRSAAAGGGGAAGAATARSLRVLSAASLVSCGVAGEASFNARASMRPAGAGVTRRRLGVRSGCAGDVGDAGGGGATALVTAGV